MLLCHQSLDFMKWLVLLLIVAYDGGSVFIPFLRHSNWSLNLLVDDDVSWDDVGVADAS